jgi:uncharacterized protein (TIGR02996 family)
MVIGRGLHCALRIDSARLSREHSAIEERDGQWWVSDLGSSFGTWLTRSGALLGRVMAPVVLQHADVIGLHDQVRIELEEPHDALATGLEEALFEHPDDENAWSVYADRLLELGDARGERIRSNAIGWTWPGHQVGHVLSSPELCEPVWAHGHLRTVVLRQQWHQEVRPWLDHCVLVLVSAPISKFLLELNLELQADFVRGAELQAVLSAAHLPSLRRFSVTPMSRVYRLPNAPRLTR